MEDDTHVGTRKCSVCLYFYVNVIKTLGPRFEFRTKLLNKGNYHHVDVHL